MKKTLAMIMAGGRGKRMDIFCQQRPKPALPFAGNLQVIDFTLSNCIHSQITNIAVLVDYQRSTMTAYLNRWNSANAGRSDLAILAPRDGSYAGTADAVYQNLNHVAKQNSDRVLVLAGDHIYNMDYQKMLAFHDASGADVTVGVVRVPMQEAHRFGTVTIESGGRIIGFEEKVSQPQSNLASMGIYIFNRDILAQRLAEDAVNPVSAHDFGYAILPGMVGRDKVFAFEYQGYWQDIGTVEAYYEANMQLLSANPLFNLDSTWPIFSSHEPCSLPLPGKNGQIVNSLVSPGCIVEGYVENSILSPGVRVAEKAKVINSVVMANTRIGYHSVVDRCILDEKVEIGKFCYVGFGTAPLPGVCDITMVGKDVNVAPQTAIGRKSKILPGLRMAELGARFVAPGTVVSVPG